MRIESQTITPSDEYKARIAELEQDREQYQLKCVCQIHGTANSGTCAECLAEQYQELEQELSDKAPHYMDCIDRERKLTEENQRLREALEEIVDKEGKVCEQFELCKHESCRSSCSSWFIAKQALEGRDE